MSYSDLEYELFSRQFILKNFNDENILKLNNAKIVIVGLGGIACPLAQYLVSSGVKNLTFFDGDMIEKSNLGRQILYTLEDVGKYKALVAKDKLLDFALLKADISRNKFINATFNYIISMIIILLSYPLKNSLKINDKSLGKIDFSIEKSRYIL